MFHIVLSVVGIVLTLTAAYEFKHKNVRNIASGTLDEHTTVTFDEMIEHSFYQCLNLAQIIYLHLLSFEFGTQMRYILVLGLASSLWLIRDRFPVNKFSDNYVKNDEKSTPLIRILYRVKKYQYVFYKHFLLHGLNISSAIYSYNIVNLTSFRLYWLLLNTSYTMEFFLQTLVKKKFLKQRTMLIMQKILMSASTISAIYILRYVSITASLCSLFLNFMNRKHDFLNTFLILLLMTVLLVPTSTS
jgi:hypothetical protein